MNREEWWAPKFLYQCYLDRDIPWPRRTFALDRERRDLRRARLGYPWDARRWAATEDQAPPFTVHPMLLEQERYLAATGRLPFMAPLPPRRHPR